MDYPLGLLACRVLHSVGNACRSSPGCHLHVHVYVTISEKTDYHTRSKYLSLKFCIKMSNMKNDFMSLQLHVSIK